VGTRSSATGYWGRSIFRRINAEQEQARQRALLQDQIIKDLEHAETEKRVNEALEKMLESR